MPADRTFVLAPLTEEVSVGSIMFASDPFSGLQRILSALGHRRVRCEPALAAAAKKLGLPVTELDIDALELRADLALAIGDLSDIPPTEPPLLRRYLLQGLGALRGSLTWERLDGGRMAFASVQGRSVSGDCDADATLTFGLVPEAFIHIVANHPTPFDLIIRLDPQPAYIVEALSRAYALPFRPSLQLDGRFPPSGWLDRMGPAIGTICYLLSLLSAHELSKSMLLTDPSGVDLRCQVQMLS